MLFQSSSMDINDHHLGPMNIVDFTWHESDIFYLIKQSVVERNRYHECDLTTGSIHEHRLSATEEEYISGPFY